MLDIQVIYRHIRQHARNRNLPNWNPREHTNI